MVVVTFLVSVALAGCTTDSGTLGTEDVTLVTDPNDFSYLENETANDRAHVHDYWGGLDRLVIADDTFRCNGNLLTDPVICGYRPDAPIPLGTGIVEVTIDWTEDPEADDVSYYLETELWVKTANDTESYAIGQVEKGDLITLEATNEDADLPHQRISSWEFELYVYGDRDAPFPLAFKRFHADIDIRIEAVRTLEIPLFPGHPDLWQNRTEIPLVTDYRYPENGDELASPVFTLRADDRRIRPDDGAIVPSDASWIEVVLESNAYSLWSDEVDLLYHGGADREWVFIEPVEDTTSRRVYHIRVEGDGDSPYALQSVWEFSTQYGHGPSPVDDIYHGYYTVQATVYKDAIA